MQDFDALHYVKNVARDNNIKLTPRTFEAVAERVDALTSYETVVKLLQVAYDSTGPKGLSTFVRLSDDELVMADTLIQAYSTVFKGLTLRDILAFGLKHSIRENIESLPDARIRPHKRTVRMNREMDHLIRDTIADYSNDVQDITTSTALLIGLYAASRQLARETGKTV